MFLKGQLHKFTISKPNLFQHKELNSERAASYRICQAARVHSEEAGDPLPLHAFDPFRMPTT